MNNNWMKWFLFVGLSFIWGSSFILMKGGMTALTAIQVASLRIVASGLVLLPMAIRNIKKIPVGTLLPVFLSGTLGSMLPSYLFCMAEQVIDSSLAGMLNSLTPIFVIVTGAVFFRNVASSQKVIGVLIAFSGCVFLFVNKPGQILDGSLPNVLMVMLATVFYGINVNLVHKYLHEIPSLQIVSVALMLNAIPAFAVLVYSGYFSMDFSGNDIWISTGFSLLLGAIGTSLANILFYVLIKKSGVIFSSMVTYGIPFVAIFWGLIFHEKTSWMQVLALCIILTGVYWANKKPRIVKT